MLKIRQLEKKIEEKHLENRKLDEQLKQLESAVQDRKQIYNGAGRQLL